MKNCLTYLRYLLHALLFFGLISAAVTNAAVLQNAGKSASIEPRNLQFSHIAEREGLSQSTINAIAQDKRGYIWLGTQEGLNRYDGYELLVFEHQQADPGSLSHDWIWSVYVDRIGTLWVGTDGGGLNRYDAETKSFTHYRHNDENPRSLANDRVRAIVQDSTGSYWIGTDGGGLDRFNVNTGEFIHYRHDANDANSLPGDKVLALYEDSTGDLWVGTDNGLARFDVTHSSFTVYRNNTSDSSSLSSNDIRKIYEDREGRFWVGTYKGGLNLLDRRTGVFQSFQYQADDEYSLSHNWVRDIYQDQKGTLWVATDAGLNELLPESGSFIRYLHDPLNPSSISDDRIASLFQDTGDVLWVGTFNGLNKWNYVSDAFEYLRLDGGDTGTALSGNIIASLAEGLGDTLWVGAYGDGLNQIDLKTGDIERLSHNSDDPQSLSDDRVMSLFAEHDGGVWVGTRNGGLNYLDPDTRTFSHYLHDPDDSSSLSSDAISAIYRDKQGVLWVGTFGGGLNKFDAKENIFKRYLHDSEDNKSISSNRVLAIYQDRSNILWVGTKGGGLNRFDPITESFIHYKHDPDDVSSLSSNSALSITESKEGSLWIATLGGGLNRWRLTDRQADHPVFQKYQKADGLHSNAVFAALEDRDGFIWLSSNRGLSRLDPMDGKIQHYDRFNGLRGDDFNSGAFLKTRAGHLFFGGANGVLTFNPESLSKNMHHPEIVLTAFSRDERLASASSMKSRESLEPLVFAYDEDYVAFNFAALDFASPHMNQYRYQLQGFDQTWVEAGKLRSATYTSLPAGDYVFVVKGSNNDGVWNEIGTSIALHIKPPPWQTLWAYAFYILSLAAIWISYKKKQDMKHHAAAEYSSKLEVQVEERTLELSERNTQLNKLNAVLQEVSVTDSLTGLKNRRYLYESIDERVASVGRRAEDTRAGKVKLDKVDIAPSMFFMMIDLDGFKAVNDTHGHDAGDQVLIQVRDILHDSCRESDTIIRWGGDEFLIVGETPSAHAAEHLAERIRHNLAEQQYQVGDGHICRVSGSIGFAMYPFSPFAKADLLSWEQTAILADHAAYTAKKNGRNAWVGIYGSRSSTWAQITKTNINIVGLADKGVITLETSLGSLHEAVKPNQHTGL